jgi:hypothetical protein
MIFGGFMDQRTLEWMKPITKIFILRRRHENAIAHRRPGAACFWSGSRGQGSRPFGAVCVALENALKKNRAEINAADLEKITDLKLPHIPIKSFKDDDFAGLTKLKKLHFFFAASQSRSA